MYMYGHPSIFIGASVFDPNSRLFPSLELFDINLKIRDQEGKDCESNIGKSAYGEEVGNPDVESLLPPPVSPGKTIPGATGKLGWLGSSYVGQPDARPNGEGSSRTSPAPGNTRGIYSPSSAPRGAMLNS